MRRAGRPWRGALWRWASSRAAAAASATTTRGRPTAATVGQAPQRVDRADLRRRLQPGPGLRRGGARRGHRALDLRGRRRRGLRLRPRHRRQDRHQRPRRHRRPDHAGGERQRAKAVYVEFPDRNVVSAKIVGFDPFADVALIEVDPDGLDLHPLKLGDDSDLVVGQPVAAIGSPFGEQHSLSVGIISATDRSVDSLTEFQIEGAIQTDAAINPGNSGGPLLDAEARGGRHQPADPDRNRLQRRGRLRDPDLGGQTLGRPARGRRQGRIRLHRRLHPGALPAARRRARPRRRLRRPDRRSRPRRAGGRSRARGRRRQDPLPGLPGHRPAAT